MRLVFPASYLQEKDDSNEEFRSFLDDLAFIHKLPYFTDGLQDPETYCSVMENHEVNRLLGEGMLSPIIEWDIESSPNSDGLQKGPNIIPAFRTVVGRTKKSDGGSIPANDMGAAVIECDHSLKTCSIEQTSMSSGVISENGTNTTYGKIIAYVMHTPEYSPILGVQGGVLVPRKGYSREKMIGFLAGSADKRIVDSIEEEVDKYLAGRTQKMFGYNFVVRVMCQDSQVIEGETVNNSLDIDILSLGHSRMEYSVKHDDGECISFTIGGKTTLATMSYSHSFVPVLHEHLNRLGYNAGTTIDPVEFPGLANEIKGFFADFEGNGVAINFIVRARAESSPIEGLKVVRSRSNEVLDRESPDYLSAVSGYEMKKPVYMAYGNLSPHAKSLGADYPADMAEATVVIMNNVHDNMW